MKTFSLQLLMQEKLFKSYDDHSIALLWEIRRIKLIYTIIFHGKHERYTELHLEE